MRYLHYSIICLLLFCKLAFADDKSEVKDLLKGKIDAVVLLLQDKSSEKQKRDDQIIAIVTPIFDYQTMAKLSLGKKYWPGLSEEKREAFSDLFIKRLQESYLEKLDLYTDEKALYEEAQQVNNKIHMPTFLVSKDNHISMLYKFYKAKAGWQIYDVEIEGVSIIQTYRSQFDGVLKTGTIDDLLEKLKIVGEFTISSPSNDSPK